MDELRDHHVRRAAEQLRRDEGPHRFDEDEDTRGPDAGHAHGDDDLDKDRPWPRTEGGGDADAGDQTAVLTAIRDGAATAFGPQKGADATAVAEGAISAA